MYRSFFFPGHCIKQIDSMLPWVCLVIDHRGRQNVVKTSVSHSPAACLALHCFYHILTSSVICSLSVMNRPTATWNLFVNLIILIVSRAESKEY